MNLILNNFFTQIIEGHTTLKGLIEAGKVPRGADLEPERFLELIAALRGLRA